MTTNLGALLRHPLDQLREPRMGRRLPQLLGGLVLYGLSMALLVQAGLGLDPWDVLHEGLAGITGLSFGTIVILTGAVVLLAWIPLRLRVGVGTIANVVVIGLAADLGLALFPRPEALWLQIAFLVVGTVLNGLAGALYVGTRLGTGPRDGLWVAISSRSGRSVRLVRTVLEVTVLGIGWLLGGSVGVGTVVYALAIGPVVQLFLPRVTVPVAAAGPGADPVPDGERPAPEAAHRP
ncbi:YczE/YyaS/YitT family protein [Serinibacter arcticus]|uniref:membrane protein YczE n=1 Tax=Serinibacter arcticus TaxID=1655435 RepID=UPI001F44617D|nr:hypothetical protein [Serinibacter arcticus]